MNNLPRAPELLAIARETLTGKLRTLPADEAKYTLAMIANAMAIAAREAQAGEKPAIAALKRLDRLHGDPVRELHGTALDEALEAHELKLAADIRAGRYDTGDARQQALLDHLTESVREKLKVSNPRSLEAKTA